MGKAVVSLFLRLVLAAAFAACLAVPAAAEELTVFAASSLSDVMDELTSAFLETQPGLRVSCNYASSSTLAAQLKQGEVADVFASANEKQMQVLVDSGLIQPAAPVVFARNLLVVIAPADNPARLSSWEDIGRRKLALVLAAPGVPVRDYTEQMATKAAADPGYGPIFRDRLFANLVSEEANVRQTAAKVSLGEADAAVVYSTDVTADIAGRVKRFDIPERFNVRASYPIAVLAGAPHAAPAAAFVRFVLGPDGRALLARHGFILPGEDR